MIKPLVALTSAFVIGALATYFFEEYEAKAEAAKETERQKMSAMCPDTLPGRKLASMKAMNQACRAEGYID